MDKFNVILNVKGSHVEGEEENTLELLTEGSLTKYGEDKYIIEYDESEISGYESFTTRVIIDGDKIALQRSGAVESGFVFKKSQKYEAIYKTPFGNKQVSILPTLIASEVSAEKGSIGLEYVVSYENYSALGKLYIDYKSKN